MKKMLSIFIAAAMASTCMCTVTFADDAVNATIVNENFNNTIAATGTPDFSAATYGTGVASYDYTASGDSTFAMTPAYVLLKSTKTTTDYSYVDVNFTSEAQTVSKTEKEVEVTAKVYASTTSGDGSFSIFDSAGNSLFFAMYNPIAYYDDTAGAYNYLNNASYTQQTYMYVKATINLTENKFYLQTSADGTTYSTSPEVLSLPSGFADVAGFQLDSYGWSGYGPYYVAMKSVQMNKTAKALALDTLSVPTTTTDNITLPYAAGAYDVTWTTSDTNVITSSGIVTRSEGNKTATLTATITDGTFKLDRTYNVTVLGTGAATYSTDSFAYADGAFNGNVKVSATTEAVPVTVIIAKYNDDGTLVAVKTTTETVAAGSTDHIVKCSLTSDALTIGQTAILYNLNTASEKPNTASTTIAG